MTALQRTHGFPQRNTDILADSCSRNVKIRQKLIERGQGYCPVSGVGVCEVCSAKDRTLCCFMKPTLISDTCLEFAQGLSRVSGGSWSKVKLDPF